MDLLVDNHNNNAYEYANKSSIVRNKIADKLLEVSCLNNVEGNDDSGQKVDDSEKNLENDCVSESSIVIRLDVLMLLIFFVS